MRPQQQQRYISKLEKISQTSSPSKQQQSPIETASIKSRINPISLSTTYLKFKRFEEEKQKKHFHLQESIRDQKEEGNLLIKDKTDIDGNNKMDTIEDKNHKISSLQETIIRKKMQLTKLEESYQNRSNSILEDQDRNKQVMAQLLKSTLNICQKSKSGRQSYLNMVLKYSQERRKQPEYGFKYLIEWNMKIVKQFFTVLGNLLNIPIR